jgi:hypothetical protein
MAVGAFGKNKIGEDKEQSKERGKRRNKKGRIKTL